MTIAIGDDNPLSPVPASGQDGIAGVDPDAVLPICVLTYLEERDEVTVGCDETGSYAVLPVDGAALLRQLESGMTPANAARWYAEAYGESVDIAEFVEGLYELGFIRASGADAAPPAAPVRWTRLGRVLFSPVSAVVFVAIMAAWLVLAIRFRQLAPANHDLFFTRYVSIVALVDVGAQIPLLLLHEAFHVLAGRRLGLRTRLSVGRRLYYIVFQTEMDGLVTVPRSKRYLPILAGIICDLAVAGILTLIAAAFMEPGGQISLVGRIALSIAYTVLLRVGWQLLVYLRTDLYYLLTTVTGCVDLNAAATATLRDRLDRLTGRARHRPDLSAWHPHDLAVARWYSWLLLGGYAYSLAALPIVYIPVLIQLITIMRRSLAAPGTQAVSGLTDCAVFFLLIVLQVAALVWLRYRERRRDTPRPQVLS